MISLILAIVIWILIREHLVNEGIWEQDPFQRNRQITPKIDVSNGVSPSPEKPKKKEEPSP